MRSATRIRSEIRINRSYSAAELAVILRITVSYFHVLAKEGVFKPIKNADGDRVFGRYDLIETVGDYVSWLAAQKKIQPPSHVEMEQAKLRKVRANAMSAEMLVAEQAGLLLRKEDVLKTWMDLILAFRSKLMSFPARTARRVQGKDDLKEIMQILKQEIEEAMRDLREIPVAQYRTRKSKSLVDDKAKTEVEREQ